MSDAIRKCSVEKCHGKHVAKGYCTKHYKRLQKWGNPIGGNDRFHTPEEAFEARTEWQGECLVWDGAKSSNDQNSYGQLQVDGKLAKAHRYAWERVRGKLPDAIELDHTCWNKSCVNINHLRPASKPENGAYLQGPYSSNRSSGVRNVTWHKQAKKWHVKVQKNGKKHHFGLFADLEDAATAAKLAREELFGEFAGRG